MGAGSTSGMYPMDSEEMRIRGEILANEIAQEQEKLEARVQEELPKLLETLEEQKDRSSILYLVVETEKHIINH